MENTTRPYDQKNEWHEHQQELQQAHISPNGIRIGSRNLPRHRVAQSNQHTSNHWRLGRDSVEHLLYIGGLCAAYNPNDHGRKQNTGKSSRRRHDPTGQEIVGAGRHKTPATKHGRSRKSGRSAEIGKRASARRETIATTFTQPMTTVTPPMPKAIIRGSRSMRLGTSGVSNAGT